jgi:RNA polymerase sigma-70 factor (ECF subfamily)
VDNSDAELVTAACGGDLDSFRQLYERYHGMAVGIARSRLGDRHLAEDAAQEAFAVACRGLHSLRDGSRFPAWLAKICRRTAVRMTRAQPNGQPLRHEPADQSADDTAAKSVRVERALTQLAPAAREVIQLHYFSGLSYEEIARALKTTPQAVHGRLQRARRILADELGTVED